MLLYCMEINKRASAAPVVQGQPLFTGTRRELFTNIRYEQRLCHEYRAGLEAGRLIRGEVGMRGLEKAVLHNFASHCLLQEGDPVTHKEDTIQCRLSS